MEVKTLTTQESMEVIARMIEASKQRLSMPDLRISVLWAVLTIATAATVLIVSLIDYNPLINLVWFAIPVIGLPANLLMARKEGVGKGFKTAIDVISDGIWRTVGVVAILLSLMACHVLFCIHCSRFRGGYAGHCAKGEFICLRWIVLNTGRIRSGGSLAL